MTGQRNKAETGRRSCGACGGVTEFVKGRIKKKQCPCAHCGQLPINAILNVRAFVHFVATATAVAIIAIALPLTAIDGMSITTWTLSAGIVCLLSLLTHVGTACWDPNRNPETNRIRREQFTADGVILVGGEGTGTTTGKTSTGFTPQRTALLCASAVGVIMLASAEFYATQRGWISNSELGFLGPGDTFTISFENTRRSINGKWRGGSTARVILSDERPIRLDGLVGNPPKGDWGNIVFDGDTQPFKPEATVTLPDRAELSWKRLTLRVGLGVSFPVPVGADRFDVKTAGFNRPVSVVLSEPRAAALYNSIWKFTAPSGAVIFLFAGFGLAASPPKTSSLASRQGPRHLA